MTGTTISSKPHYAILDGLRGVAALMVVVFHLMEAHATSHSDQLINHGYLAVDFFFLLSGFVIGYAYDDRWGKLTFKGFVRRRLIRLQPMVIMGMVIGAVFFYFQKGELWPAISGVPLWKMLLIMLIAFTMIPVTTAGDIRGWHEMYPLNGPAWSLFFEYVGNILYGLFIRRFSNAALAILVFIAAGALVHLAVTGANGDLIGGWSLDTDQLRIGFTRLCFPFFGGLLLSRVVSLKKISNAFLWCSLLLIAAMAMPRIGGEQHWQNGLYDSMTVILLFPLIVYMGACGSITGKRATAVSKFLGDISYPVYIIHYPLIYTYTNWVATNKISLYKGLPVAAGVFIAAVAIAYACLKWYDEPLRKWLQKKTIS